MKSPIISVLMPVYNTAKYLQEAIQSILIQTYTDFEFIIIDDGSTDESLRIIQSFKDKRIRLIQNEVNKGLIYTLNKGIDLANGEYIARMDADDISYPKRFELQINFLKKHPDTVLIGGQCRVIFSPKRFYTTTLNYPTNTNQIHCYSLFISPFSHPTIMGKTAILKQYKYDKSFYVAEDFHLWTRIVQRHKTANLNQGVLDYRRHEQSETLSKQVEKQESLIRLYQGLLINFGIEHDESDLKTHFALSMIKRRLPIELSTLNAIEKWLKKLLIHNKETKYYDTLAFELVISILWKNACARLSHPNLFLIFLKSELPKKNVFMSIWFLIKESTLVIIKSILAKV